MNPDCLIPLLEYGDLLSWAGVAWVGLLAVSKYLGKREAPGRAGRGEPCAIHDQQWGTAAEGRDM